MRTSWALCAWVVACAACDGGIYLEIHAPDGVQVDEVQLVIANKPCDIDDGECFAIKPEGLERISTDEIYFHANADQEIVGPMVDGTASFELAADGGLAQIVVLGFSAASPEPIAAAVMVPINLGNARVKYVVDMQPAIPFGVVSPQRGIAVKLWRSPAGLRCYGAHDESSERGAVFIVPAADPDCDSVDAALECDPLAYKQMDGLADPSNPTCVNQFVVEGSLACQIGGVACNELTGQGESCAPTNWCVPDEVCTKCKSVDSFDLACFAGAMRAPETSAISCLVQVEPAGNGDFRPCTSGSPTTTTTFDTLGQARCAGAPQLTILEAASGLPSFGEQIQIDTGNNHVLGVKALNHAEPCTFDLLFEGSVDAGVVNNAGLGATAVLKFDTGVSEPRTVLMPFHASFVDQGCIEPTACEPAAFDGVYTCAL